MRCFDQVVFLGLLFASHVYCQETDEQKEDPIEVIRIKEAGSDDKDENVLLAVLVSTGAGLATAIGGATPFFPALRKISQPKVLSASLAMSAGVMVYVSFVEIFVKANDAITLGTSHSTRKLGDPDDQGVYEVEEVGFVYPGEKLPNLYTTLSFFVGCLMVVLIQKLVHCISPVTEELEDHDVISHHEEAHAGEASGGGDRPADTRHREPAADPETNGSSTGEELNDVQKKSLEKMGLLTALALGLHNFPEGFATFIATLEDPALGFGLATAIAIHNIPEGICVAMPVYYATGSKWKALGWAFLSGLSEPLGGVLGWLALRSVFTDLVFGLVFGTVGGMMVWIVLSELLPTAYSHDPTGKIAAPFTFLGMVVISASLVAFAFA